MKNRPDKTNRKNLHSRVLIRNLVFLVFWATLFTLAYAQSPLYTSNQNQYFLHGFAQAGFGNLSEDWLANTLDPTPVFSKFIEISWRALPWQPIFYLYFGVLAGILLLSVYGIANLLWGLDKSRPQRWLYLSSIIVIFSAAAALSHRSFAGNRMGIPFRWRGRRATLTRDGFSTQHLRCFSNFIDLLVFTQEMGIGQLFAC